MKPWLRAGIPIFAIACSMAVVVSFSCSSSSDAGATDAGDEGQQDADVCGKFTGTGTPCAPISPIACFPECDAGGCYCRLGSNGQGMWVCVTDLSCVPDSAPSEDAGLDEDANDQDSGELDAGDSGIDDAGDGGD